MSRTEFRARVTAPRPASAWVMAFVASATLWITGQIEAWVIAVQVVTYSTSFWYRAEPRAWQRSPIALNVGMLFITSMTIHKALQGNPAPVSLAYFSALAQGLQLVDSRPRKSEFLLVALALFQVILASNLTDSVFFPPLVLAFLVSVTWTLLVHTIHTEAAEAGDPAAAGRAITPGLLRITLAATGGCLVLALVLFLLLPRVKTGVVRGGLGGGLAMAGFSDSVQLGAIGRIRQDDTVVLRVEALSGDTLGARERYWRGLAFDAFDGARWAITAPPRRGLRNPVSGVPRFGVNLGDGPAPDDRIERIVREPVEAGVVFGSGPPTRFEGPFQILERDPNDGLYVVGKADERIRYTLYTASHPFTPDRLGDRRARPPLEPAVGGRKPAERYLRLPDFDPRIREIAREIVAGAETDAERVLAIEARLRRDGRYTDTPPDPDPALGVSPIESFLLGEQAGHCEYFASAMVVLVRSVGLPARLVNGFAGGRPNPVGGFIELTSSDAHAWVEVHFEEAGWVRFDPTPPDLRLRRLEAPSFWAQVSDLGSAIELWWFQRVVDFDSADQIGALKSLWLAWRSARGDGGTVVGGTEAPTRPDRPRSFEAKLPRLPAFAWASIAIGALLAVAVARRRRSERGPSIPRAYQRALHLLARRGMVRKPSTSARAFAADVDARLPGAPAAAFRSLTELYLAERFGGRSSGEEAEARLANLRAELRRPARVDRSLGA